VNGKFCLFIDAISRQFEINILFQQLSKISFLPASFISIKIEKIMFLIFRLSANQIVASLTGSAGLKPGAKTLANPTAL